MDTWEHRWAYLDLTGQLDDGITQLDELGAEGWEAAGLLPNPSKPQHALVLMKRRKSGGEGRSPKSPRPAAGWARPRR